MNWLRRALFGNLLLKLSALVCAGVLWVYVDSVVTESRSFLVPAAVSIAMTKGSLQQEIAPHSNHVLVTVRGLRRAVNALRNDQIRACVVVWGSVRPGRTTVHIGPDDIELLAHKELVVVKVVPDSFAVVVRGEDGG